ncbi:MAG: 3-keto-disaccharide hydrolase [Planctomycetota bacterium]|jgi:hypothetical protein
MLSIALGLLISVAPAADFAAPPPSDLWEAMNLDGGPAPDGTWSERVTDMGDLLHCTGEPKGFLASRAHYRTMELEFEWRWPEEPGNSGLLLFTETLGFVSQPGLIGGWPRNLEVQLQSGDAGHFVLLGPDVALDVLDPETGEVHTGERNAGIFRRRAVDDVEKPLGEWNKMRVEVGLDEIVVYVNGTEVNRGVGGSLTAAHPAGFHPGAFAFQSEGAPIQFRNVSVNGVPTHQPRSLWGGLKERPLSRWTAVRNDGQDNVVDENLISYWTTKGGAESPKHMWFGINLEVDRGGALICSGQPAGYLRTHDSFGDNYHLSLEWAWEGDRGGNSGVLLHVTQPDVLFGWPQSMEVQLQSGSAGDFWVIGEDQVDVTVPNMAERRTAKKEGDLHSHRRIRRLPFEESPERPVGQWNRMDIDLNGDRIRVWVNGRLVNEGSGLTVRSGAIALQSEGTPIRFRNVYVR